MAASRLAGKIVLVTGATAGIGEACATRFAAVGAHLVLCGRREDRLEALATKLKTAHPDMKIFTGKCDVRELTEVQQFASSIPDDLKEIDILINNAGLALGKAKAQETLTEDINGMIDTNVKGLLWVQNTFVPGMVARQRGHIINVSSIAGHDVYPGGSVYCGTKFAVDAITRGLRIDLVDTPLRVTAIAPGMVDTEFSTVRFKGDSAVVGTVYKGLEPLTAEDIADDVLYAAGRPPHVQVAEILTLPTAQASANHVSRK